MLKYQKRELFNCIVVACKIPLPPPPPPHSRPGDGGMGRKNLWPSEEDLPVHSPYRPG